MCRKKVRGERCGVLVQDQVGGNQPLSFRVHRQRRTLQGVGPQQGRGLVLSKDHDGDHALAVYRSPRLSVVHKHGKDACNTPRLNARRFEELVIGKIRSNVLTDSNIRALVKVVDEQTDSVAAEQRKRLENIEDELEDVKRKLGRIWHFIETADNVEMTDASDRIREHQDRQERLEELAADARAILSQRRAVLDDVEPIAACAQEMSEFLKESELTERRAFIETFVKEIVVMPGDALVRYTIPMPDDSPIPGRNAEEMALNGSVLSTVKNGGRCRTRTYDPLRVKQML